MISIKIDQNLISAGFISFQLETMNLHQDLTFKWSTEQRRKLVVLRGLQVGSDRKAAMTPPVYLYDKQRSDIVQYY